MACTNNGTTFDFAGNYVEKVGIDILGGIIQDHYERALKDNDVNSLDELWKAEGLVQHLTAEEAKKYWDDLPDKEKDNVQKYYKSDERGKNSDLSHELRQWIIAEADTTFPELRQEAEKNDRKLKLKAITVCACCMNEFGPEHGRGRYIDRR